MTDAFWLNGPQWAQLAPLLLDNTRGVPRVNERRVISGIIHVLQSGFRWWDAPADYGPDKDAVQPVRSLAAQRGLGGVVSDACRSGGAASDASARQHLR